MYVIILYNARLQRHSTLSWLCSALNRKIGEQKKKKKKLRERGKTKAVAIGFLLSAWKTEFALAKLKSASATQYHCSVIIELIRLHRCMHIFLFTCLAYSDTTDQFISFLFFKKNERKQFGESEWPIGNGYERQNLILRQKASWTLYRRFEFDLAWWSRVATAVRCKMGNRKRGNRGEVSH